MTTIETLSWVNEVPRPKQSKDSVKELHSEYRPRKAHTKSRKGCQNCRRRKIKCDEARPNCGQCEDRLMGSIRCEFFPLSQKPADEILDASFQHGNKTTKTQEFPHGRDALAPYLRRSGIPCRPSIYVVGDSLDLLGHFVGLNTPVVGSSSFQRIIQKHLALSYSAPYLMHAVLAFSASHLAYLQPEEKLYDLEFRRHYSLSLSTYSSQLQSSFDKKNADAIVASSYLHTMLAFSNAKTDESPGTESGFTWLRAMRGVSIVWNIKDVYSHLDGSIWAEMQSISKVLEVYTCNHTEPDAGNNRADQTSVALHLFFNSHCDADTYKLSFQKPLSRLCQLMRSGMGQTSICAFMSFVGQLPDSFLKLLDARDYGAMLILCYWSAFLVDLEQWWIVASAKAVCRRLCEDLESVPGNETLGLLSYPASKCGYTTR